MSSLCGWLGAGESEQQSETMIGAMAGRLPAGDRGVCSGPGWGLAAVQGSAAEVDGVAVALAGYPRFTDSRLQALAREKGPAAAVAAAYREHGADCLQGLAGGFAVAIAADGGQQGLIAVDRMGIGSLTYAMPEAGLIFGSTADAVNAHPLSQRRLNRQALFDYVYFHMVPGPETIFTEQYRLLPGTYVAFERGQARLGRYWEASYQEPRGANFEASKAEFMDCLRAGVSEHLNGGGKLGAFLSGGTDSSTVAGILTQVSGAPAHTYSIGFDAEGYDEMEYARLAARHFGTDHHEYYVTPKDVADAIPKVAAAYDQPFGNASAVPSYYCAKLAREDGVTTMLGGDGGDELFGGNARYAKQRIFALYDNLPSPLQSMLPAAVGALPGRQRLGPVRKVHSYLSQAAVPMPARLETYNLVNRVGIERIFERDFLADIDTAHPEALQKTVYDSAHAHSMLNRMLALDMQFTLADNDLRKVTRMCELAGVEAAFPLLDERLFELSARLPLDYKLKGTRLRWFFKEALKDFLPTEIIHKTKHGFGLPFGLWFQTDDDLRALAHDSLNDLKGRHIVRGAFIDELTSQHLNTHAAYYGTLVWVLMMLEQWFKHHVD